ncbi:MAG: hypothetical protein LUQ38_10670 [Methanotrichaceae archaeon]|nr:hypothetical protein [Methanotrichaceae archaeon]
MKKELVLALAIGLVLAGTMYAVAKPGNPGNDGQTWPNPPLGESSSENGPNCNSIENCCTCEAGVCTEYAVKECTRPLTTDSACICEEYDESGTCVTCEMVCEFACPD